VTVVSAMIPVGPYKSATESAISALLSSVRSRCGARSAWTFLGRRPSQSVCKMSSGNSVPARPRRCRRNCDGLRSPRGSFSNRRRVFCSRDEPRRLINSVFKSSYDRSPLGRVSISRTSRAYLWSRAVRTWSYLVLS